jgi:hypothetical protein
MKLNFTPAKNDTLTNDTSIGWLNMPAFGSGYLEFISRDLADDDFEPAAALSDDANDALAELPVEASTDEGWSSVANRFQATLRESFWSAITTAIDLRPGKSVAA